MPCLSCLQHRRTLKLDLFTIETTNDFTYVHKTHIFKVERRQSDLNASSKMAC